MKSVLSVILVLLLASATRLTAAEEKLELSNREAPAQVGEAAGQGMKTLRSSVEDVATKDARPESDPPQPTSRTSRVIEGWTVRVDDRLLETPNEALGERALKFLEAKLMEIRTVVPEERVKELQTVTIVLDLTCGKLDAMQYHPSAGWLQANGYPRDLAGCVHLPRAANVPTRRNINEQPWVILHELAHAYHHQRLGFDDPRILAAYERYKNSGNGEATLLYNGRRVKHYALTNHKEFFAEMTESFFGMNDFYPFNRAELQEAEPEVYKLLAEIWGVRQ